MSKIAKTYGSHGEIHQDLKGYTNQILIKNHGKWKNRILIGTPMTGQVRVEWALARFGQVIPTNWSSSDVFQNIPTVGPMGFLVCDAQNVIVKEAVEKEYEWLFLVEHDNVLPPGAFLRLNDYMRKGDIPIVSGLYFTKSQPPEPMVYRGKGVSYFDKWHMGDKVWASGVPTGSLLIHGSILKALWNESPSYKVGATDTRRVFEEPAKMWFDPVSGGAMSEVATSDLAFCWRIMKDKIFEKAGWPKYQKMKFPYLVDTDIFVRHIDPNGRMYPITLPLQFMPRKKGPRTVK